jgi:hypothetical protein
LVQRGEAAGEEESEDCELHEFHFFLFVLNFFLCFSSNFLSPFIAIEFAYFFTLNIANFILYTISLSILANRDYE